MDHTLNTPEETELRRKPKPFILNSVGEGKFILTKSAQKY